MLRRHRRLEMRSAKLSCSALVSNKLPIFPVYAAHRDLGSRETNSPQDGQEPLKRGLTSLSLPFPLRQPSGDKTALYTPERSSPSYCLLPPSTERKTLALTRPQSSPAAAAIPSFRPSRAALPAHQAELQPPAPGLLLPTTSSAETGPAFPLVSQGFVAR